VGDVRSLGRTGTCRARRKNGFLALEHGKKRPETPASRPPGLPPTQFAA